VATNRITKETQDAKKVNSLKLKVAKTQIHFRALNSAAAMMLMKKSDSDKALNNGKTPKAAKKAKKKFKRSLTMTSLPLSFFKVKMVQFLTVSDTTIFETNKKCFSRKRREVYNCFLYLDHFWLNEKKHFVEKLILD
jgi:hypothetical protein